MNKPGYLTFTCNICGTLCELHAAMLTREDPSCRSCGSSMRMRGMMHALSVALFGKALTLPEFPGKKELIGKGMSDWEGYARPLSKKFGYTNTFYHKAPLLDITNISPKDEQSTDFVVSTDVFEHVAPPVIDAFENVRKMLKPGGVFIFSVPYVLQGKTKEHFPNLHQYTIENRNGVRTLVNHTRDGSVEEFTDLIFHGGEGETLEMREFSEPDLLRDLEQAGFKDVQVLQDSYFDYGIYWPSPWPAPIIARVDSCPVRIKDWGPRASNMDNVINLQANGRSAVWLKIKDRRPGADLKLLIGGQIADGLVVTDELITGFIPATALSARGAYAVTVSDAHTDDSVHVGFLTVAG